MKLRIRTLGPLEIDIAGAAVALPPWRRVRRLLAWLALHPGQHPRSRLAGWLWPDVPGPKARASLRSAVWALRSALGPAGSAFLLSDRQTVGLREEGVSVDLAEFRAPADAGRLREAAAPPLDENAGRDLIRRFAATGDTPSALAAYERLRRRLSAVVGMAPARETRRLAAGPRAVR